MKLNPQFWYSRRHVRLGMRGLWFRRRRLTTGVVGTVILACGSFDVVIGGAPGADCAGQFPVVMRPPNLDCAYHGLIFRGAVDGGGAGYSVSSAGDINDDGIDDLVIGTGSTYPALGWLWPDNPPGIDAGEVYVVFGSPDLGSLATIELAALDGTNGKLTRTTSWPRDSCYTERSHFQQPEDER